MGAERGRGARRSVYRALYRTSRRRGGGVGRVELPDCLCSPPTGLSLPQLAARSTRSYPGSHSLCILEVTTYIPISLLYSSTPPTRCEAGGKYQNIYPGTKHPRASTLHKGAYTTKVAQGTQPSCGLSGPPTDCIILALIYYHIGPPGTSVCSKGMWSILSLERIRQSRAECVKQA